MSALTNNRDTQRREGHSAVFTAGGTIFQGGMVAMDAQGKAVAATASGTDVIGMALRPAINGEAVEVARGVYLFDNSPADALALADVGKPCYVADDQTVKKTKGTSPVAGMVFDVDHTGVWVKI